MTMSRRLRLSLAALAVTATLAAGCAPAPSERASSAPTPQPSASPSLEAPSTEAPVPGDTQGEIIVRFSNDDNHADVVMAEDSPAVKDFLSMLPLELSLEDFNQKEKISYLPRELAWEGSSGFDPEDGDLIYYTPWGNLGFYYDASGIAYSDATLKLGTFTATRSELDALDGPVTVDIVR
ncbi:MULTISPECIES: cyclophilin-like fold protein [unclassified Microbacterium]|uniref:cyclophilin-like fold protein n=1 Tax=unclassified Microbacterium TaxID=2609290 RepID=UPI001F0D635D|nr:MULTISPECIES: cyclophilin-like fold protein [unclassified Microbacterium]